MNDSEHLKLLSIFHFVVGGITGFFSCMPVFHAGIGAMMVLNPGAFGNPPVFMGLIFTTFATAIVLLGWALALSTIYAGLCLQRRTHHTFCMVVAGVNCISFPFGTTLGVFTIIVLNRPSVREMFELPLISPGGNLPPGAPGL